MRSLTTDWAVCLADGGCGGYEPPDMSWGKGRRPVVNISAEGRQKPISTGYPKKPAWLIGCRAKQSGNSPPGAELRPGPFTSATGVTTAQANFNGQYPYKNAAPGGFRSQNRGGWLICTRMPWASFRYARQCLGMDRRLLAAEPSGRAGGRRSGRRRLFGASP